MLNPKDEDELSASMIFEKWKKQERGEYNKQFKDALRESRLEVDYIKRNNPTL